MAKLPKPKRIAIPVTSLPSDVSHLACYYGPPGFTPNYEQNERISVPLDALEMVVDPDGQNYIIFESILLPQIEGTFDLYFTLVDASDYEEGDFSPSVSIPLDLTPPPRLGQPVVL